MALWDLHREQPEQVQMWQDRGQREQREQRLAPDSLERARWPGRGGHGVRQGPQRDTQAGEVLLLCLPGSTLCMVLQALGPGGAPVLSMGHTCRM